MNKIVNVFAIFLIILKNVTCVEYLGEQVWIDNRGRDKFFDYAEVAEPSTKKYYFKTANGNFDSELFDIQPTSPITAPTEKAPNTSSNPSIINIFLNTIKKVIQPEKAESHQKLKAVKETSKGLDIKLDANNNFLPNLGNNQESKFIMVGTKWCGAGDIARDRNDIGYFYLTDSCCRDHDLCPSTLAAQETKFGLKNSGKFTRSHCDCDMKFYQCLKNVNTLLSNQAGNLYFNVLGHQCFKEDNPVTNCKSSIKSRCVHYEKDLSKAKTYQWFDNPWF